MAKKIVFISTEESVFEQEFDYQFFPGFAAVQKQKNVKSLEESIKQKYPNFKVLEVSTKSDNDLGVALSAFNLQLDGIPVESIFQSSKVFADGTQYDFLINYSAAAAKKYIKENSLGQLKCFRYKGVEYPLFPKSAFYDWIYINALNKSEYVNEVVKYDAFTDIEFNDKKSINCQARSVAIYVSICRQGKVDYYLSSFDHFIELYKEPIEDQLPLFDL